MKISRLIFLIIAFAPIGAFSQPFSSQSQWETFFQSKIQDLDWKLKNKNLDHNHLVQENLRVEENIVVNTKDIIGIFDMDNTTVSRLGRNFLAESQKNGLIINSTDDLPKSFVVVKEKDETKVFISSVSSKVLAKRGL